MLCHSCQECVDTFLSPCIELCHICSRCWQDAVDSKLTTCTNCYSEVDWSIQQCRYQNTSQETLKNTSPIHKWYTYHCQRYSQLLIKYPHIYRLYITFLQDAKFVLDEYSRIACVHHLHNQFTIWQTITGHCYYVDSNIFKSISKYEYLERSQRRSKYHLVKTYNEYQLFKDELPVRKLPFSMIAIDETRNVLYAFEYVYTHRESQLPFIIGVNFIQQTLDTGEEILRYMCITYHTGIYYHPMEESMTPEELINENMSITTDRVIFFDCRLAVDEHGQLYSSVRYRCEGSVCTYEYILKFKDNKPPKYLSSWLKYSIHTRTHTYCKTYENDTWILANTHFEVQGNYLIHTHICK